MSRHEEFDQGQPRPALSDQDRQIIDYAKNLKHGSSYLHNSEIMDKFGFQATTFYQRLNRIIDDPSAQEYDPVTAHRYQRIRDKGARRGGQ
jgi:hypothetical protein